MSSYIVRSGGLSGKLTRVGEGKGLGVLFCRDDQL